MKRTIECTSPKQRAVLSEGAQRSGRQLHKPALRALTLRSIVLHYVTLPLLLAALFAQASLGAGSDWLSFRGPNGDGSVQAPARSSSISLGWRQPIGSGYSGISIADGLLVSCAAQGGMDAVVALDMETGRQRWAVTLGEAYLGHGGSRDGVIATPAIADGTVYAFGNRGQFVAIELATGKELWRRELGEQGAEAPYYGFGSSPVVFEDLVILQLGGEAGAVMALERDTGKTAWKSFNDAIDTQSPKLIEIRGSTQLVFASDHWVGGLDPKEGTLLWRWAYEAQSSFVGSTSPLPLGGGRIFFTPEDDRAVVLDLPEVRRTTTSEEVPEAAVVWEGNVLTRTYSPAAVVGDVLVGYTSRFLGGYSKDTGKRLWRSRSPGDGFLIAVGDQLAVITKSGSLSLGDHDENGWAELAQLDLFEDIVWTPPSYATTSSGGALFVRSMTEIARVDLLPETTTKGPEGVPVTSMGDGEQKRQRTGNEGSVPAALAALASAEGSVDERVSGFLQDVITPIVEDNQALFLWRGEARDVGISGDFLGMRREGAFQRLENTDLWWYQTEVDPRLQYTYVLYVDYEPILDPLNPKREKNSVVGRNANWARSLVEMSYFAMPDWQAADSVPMPATRGRLEEVQVTLPDSASEDYQKAFEQPISVWLPASYEEAQDRRYPTVYLFEWPGVRDQDAGGWLDTLDRMGGKSFEELIVVFVQRGPPRGESMAPFVNFIDSKFRTQRDPLARANVSMGFRSVEAVALSLVEPELFRKFGVQSFFGFEEHVEDVSGSVPQLEAGAAPFVGYLDWGTMDIRSPSEGWDMRRISKEIHGLLQAKGVEMHGGEVVATTDWKSWRQRTHSMLGALFPVK